MRQAALAAAATAALLVSHPALAQLGGVALPSGVSVTVPGVPGGTIGSGVTVGPGGVSTGVTVGVPGTGGVSATAGVGSSGIGVGAGVGGVGGVGAGLGSGGVSAGAGIGGVSAGVATGGLGGSGVGGVGGAAGVGGPAASGPATTGSISGGAGAAPGFGAGPVASIALPRSLAPLDLIGQSRFTAFFPDFGSVSGTREDLQNFRRPLRARSRLPAQVVRNCREAIVAAALRYGVVRVDAAAAGPMRAARGGYSAPIEFRMVYSRRGGLETRSATVDCRMNTAGRVIAAA
jgi:hypothetical protein